MITIGLISIHYKNAKDTKALLASVEKVNSINFILKQYIVDNASNDGTMEEVEKAYPNIISIHSENNLGFAGGNNLGIARAIKNNCDYILLINNDTIINEKDFFDKLLLSKGDIISPLIKYHKNGKVTYDYGGIVDKIFGRNTHLHSLPSKTPDYFSGVCLFIKKEVFMRIKMDDRYFLYYEDVDFCLRAKENGFKLGFCPSVSIFHSLSSSTNKIGKRKIIILANSHLRFCLKHLPIFSFPFYFTFNLYLRLKTLL